MLFKKAKFGIIKRSNMLTTHIIKFSTLTLKIYFPVTQQNKIL